MQTTSATLSADDRAAIADALTTIKQRLPFLVDLVSEERMTRLKIGDKSRAFVSKALRVAAQNPDFLPRSFDVEKMHKDVALLEDLSSLLIDLIQLHNLVDDTCMVLGSEAYAAALTVYNYAKTSGQATNGLEPVIDEMRQHFRKPRKAKSQNPVG
jgi:hypothetical protein